MSMAGGGYLGRLRKSGYITWENRLTRAGSDAIRDFTPLPPAPEAAR